MVEVGNGGRIVNTASLAGTCAVAAKSGGSSTYAAGKAALV